MLKKLLFFGLIIFSLAPESNAQSGRKITAPAPEKIIETVQDKEEYSETAPTKPVTVYISPKDRAKRAKRNEKKSTQSAAASPNSETVAADEDVVKIETNLVTIPVSVYERNGLYVPNLRQTDFKIFENGKEQEIAYFGTSDKPFTVVLLIDTSPSTAYKIDEIQQAAIAFVNNLKPQDNVMVIEFDAGVHVLSELTNDRAKIYKAIKRADFGDGTSLYDAVDFSLRKRLDKIEGRKAIVLFTDGVDTTSFKAKYDTTIVDAEESEAMIFPIYYNTYFDNTGIGKGGVMSSPPILGDPGAVGNARGTSSSEYALGKRYLEDLATVTGGRVFRPEATPGGLTAAFEGIAEELRRQYSIGFYPQAEGRAGEKRQLKVRVNRPNLVVRSRDSYIVGGNNQTQDAK